MMRWLLALIILWGLGGPLHAKTVRLDGPVRESIALRGYEDFYRDTTQKLALSDILQENRVNWRPLPRPMLGLSHDALWVRVQLHNSTSGPLDILIEDRWPQTNSLEFQVLHGDQVIAQQKSGDSIPLRMRPIPYRYPVFDVTLPPGDSTLYMRYHTNDLLSSRLFLSSEVAFNQTREVEKLVFGLLLGCLLIMPLYNIMLYFLLKDSSYLYYAVYGLLYVVFQASVNGLWFQYVFDHPWMNDELSMISAYLSVFFVYRFVGIFLDLKLNMPRVAAIIGWFEKASLFAAVLTLVHLGSAIAIGFVTNICMAFWMVYTSYVMSRRGYKPAIFFLAAWLLFLIGDSFTIMGYLGLMDEGMLTQWGMLAGSAVEMVLVSIAMGYKFEGIRQALIASEIETSKLIGSMESARIIQESLVSRHVRSSILEVASYYRSAELTGGDWFSIVDRPEQNFTVFALGDVTGHGLSSSMMTAFACGALEASVHNLDWAPDQMETSLAKLAETFNQLLYRTATSNDRLMTMSVFVIDLVRLQGYYVNCGHHASYLLTRERLAPIFRRGSILGLQSVEARFHVLSFKFQVGDTLLLHSDGLVENSGPNGELFPMHRVETLLDHSKRAGDNLQSILTRAQAIWKDRAPEDDVTVLLIRIAGAAPGQKALPKQLA
ncbi:MAG TPA: 7TM diverse intracellular signaling domain-containing protein [Oligoflexus sp.]|uniref:7TM diverse intracellular signaling domain-containing protein n=1 Tax=Oligoflexus sp. TaxID=1971216 RepID=UPI002D43966B|nr:7TM diverse intracellular signaling domain-containing protein [Oligoflexus sp.]HYX32354.1 7TM diverse intracellular signaling domain-containing protein [Oligoflexus sp.]